MFLAAGFSNVDVEDGDDDYDAEVVERLYTELNKRQRRRLKMR